jgi:hypothetical protein
MTNERRPSSPQFHADRSQEQEAVRTTIVGGRPPGSGKGVGNIPRGIEVLVKKAAVDPAFKAILLDRRASAAGKIGLELGPAEAMMLAAAPRDQLEAVIDNMHVPEEHRRAFLGKVAAVMLAAIATAVTGCPPPQRPATKGIRPERWAPKKVKDEPPPSEVKPDRPKPAGTEAGRQPTKEAEPSPLRLEDGPRKSVAGDETSHKPLKQGTMIAGIGPRGPEPPDSSDGRRPDK